MINGTDINLITDEIPHAYDGKQISFGVSDSDKEDLLMFETSAPWKTYRKYLMGQKTARLAFLMQLDDPSKMAKELGIIVGLNLAINQIAVITMEIRKQVKKAIEEGKKQPRN